MAAAADATPRLSAVAASVPKRDVTLPCCPLGSAAGQLQLLDTTYNKPGYRLTATVARHTPHVRTAAAELDPHTLPATADMAADTNNCLVQVALLACLHADLAPAVGNRTVQQRGNRVRKANQPQKSHPGHTAHPEGLTAARPLHEQGAGLPALKSACRPVLYRAPNTTPSCSCTAHQKMQANRPMCQVTMYSQKGESMDGPVGKCASSAPIWLVNRPNRLWPPKALTGMLLGMVQLHTARQRE